LSPQRRAVQVDALNQQHEAFVKNEGRRRRTVRGYDAQIARLRDALAGAEEMGFRILMAQARRDDRDVAIYQLEAPDRLVASDPGALRRGIATYRASRVTELVASFGGRDASTRHSVGLCRLLGGGLLVATLTGYVIGERWICPAERGPECVRHARRSKQSGDQRHGLQYL